MKVLWLCLLLALPTVALAELRPKARPDTFPPTPPEGAVCEATAITGMKIAPITGHLEGCGIPIAVRITAVDGIALSQPADMDCITAQALKTWVVEGVRPAVGDTGGGLASLQVAAHYACRTRNSRPGARISEHGKGRAIDISAIGLKDGTQITVLNGWRDPVQGPILKDMWTAACGPFGTVLGPESDIYHQDHFHFDTARYRAGPYCR